jgi:penicillin amidase
VPVLSPLFELCTPTGGDAYTLKGGGASLRTDAITGKHYMTEHAASLRAIYDLGDRAQLRFMHSTGQSGLPWSAQYRDFVGPWSEVEYLPLWPLAVVASSMALRLEPVERSARS